ncbi:adenine nucleotide alpha hydrolases-like protein, partial [Thelephora ganbajun]
SRMSVRSMMEALSLFPSNDTTSDKERGRSWSRKHKLSSRASSVQEDSAVDSRASSRSRSGSPFIFRRTRTRDSSPAVGALKTDADSDYESSTRIRPRSAFSAHSDDETSGDEPEGYDDSEEYWSDDHFDPVTERNTETNAALVSPIVQEEGVFADPLGEGVNVVIPPEPYFPSTLNSPTHQPRRKKSTKSHVHERLSVVTSRPVFERDRCSIKFTQGDPEAALEKRKGKTYMVLSDLSDESRYAMEWGIGTVIRDGDELIIVTVIENEMDPPTANPADRSSKIRNQQERQALAYILVRQAISLLQRTQLNVTISCQAWHAKNARRMLLDIVDHVEPTMVIVGSRGVGKLQGILLGSTSHYLVQKCSVPVMVARRRLKRPPRKSAHLTQHRARVSLAEAAGKDTMARKVDQDVAALRDQMARDEEEADPHAPPQSNPEEFDDDDDGDDD